MENQIVVVVKAIIMFNGKVLIVQRSGDDETEPNTWEFVGGKIEFGEDLEEALTREIKEEVNLNVNIEKLIYAASFLSRRQRQLVIITYMCTANNNIVALSNEHKNYLWADKKQMMDLLSPGIINDLNRFSVWELIL